MRELSLVLSALVLKLTTVISLRMFQIALAVTSQNLILWEIMNRCGQWGLNCRRVAVVETPKTLTLQW